ncbi:hypothetical protein ACIBVL_31260 [Streptomyces sp. NPDC049687]
MTRPSGPGAVVTGGAAGPGLVTARDPAARGAAAAVLDLEPSITPPSRAS